MATYHGQDMRIEFQTDDGWKDITEETAAIELTSEEKAEMKKILPPLPEPIEITVTITDIVYDYVETESGDVVPVRGFDQ